MFFLSDFTTKVFEKRQRNSGHVEGKFADRRKLRNPETGTDFCPTDFYVGARIMVNCATFCLSRADEYTLALMEELSEHFPYSDRGMIVYKIRSLVESPGLSASSISPPALNNLVKKELKGCLVDHELVTLLRAFPAGKEGYKLGHIDLTCLRKAMQDAENPPSNIHHTNPSP